MGDHEQPDKGDAGSQQRLCSIYGLHSSDDETIRYVGQTTQPLKFRLTQHLAEAARCRGSSRAHRWIRKVLKTGHEVRITLLEAECEWDEAERRWIALYREKHPGQLTNHSDGGCGYSGKRSAETREKMRGRKSEAHKAKMRKPKSAETRMRMAQSLIGNTRGQGSKNGFAVLTEANVVDIKCRLARGESLSKIAAAFNVTKGAISKIKTGRTWSHVEAA